MNARLGVASALGAVLLLCLFFGAMLFLFRHNVTVVNASPDSLESVRLSTPSTTVVSGPLAVGEDRTLAFWGKVPDGFDVVVVREGDELPLGSCAIKPWKLSFRLVVIRSLYPAKLECEAID